MTGTHTNGFPEGYFIIRSVASNRLLDVALDSIEDGSEVILFPESETSLVESKLILCVWFTVAYHILQGRRNPNSNNQVHLTRERLDPKLILCFRFSLLIPLVRYALARLVMLSISKVNRVSTHPVVSFDISLFLDDRLVLRHRRPVSLPFPNSYSHPLPKFSYNKETAELHVEFSCDPTYPPRASVRSSGSWKAKAYLLASIPVRRPRTILDDATQLISSTLAAPFSFFSGTTSPNSTPEDVSQNGVDLKEEEVLEEDRGEEAEVDDSPEMSRPVRMLTIANSAMDDHHLVENARNRRRWQIVPLRTVSARTAA